MKQALIFFLENGSPFHQTAYKYRYWKCLILFRFDGDFNFTWHKLSRCLCKRSPNRPPSQSVKSVPFKNHMWSDIIFCSMLSLTRSCRPLWQRVNSMRCALASWSCLQRACKIKSALIGCRRLSHDTRNDNHLSFCTEKKSTRGLASRIFTIWTTDCGTWRRINNKRNTQPPCPNLYVVLLKQTFTLT